MSTTTRTRDRRGWILLITLAALAAGSVRGLAAQAAAPSFANWPLLEAAAQGNLARAKTLIGAGTDVNQAYGDGRTALHIAADRGDLELAKLLVAAGANLEAPTRIGRYTPLHLASRAGNAALVQLLIEGGADVRAVTTNTGATALHLAAESGSPDAIRILLDHGGDVNARDTEWGHTPLFFAAAYNRPDAVRLLLARGADPGITAKVIDVPHQAAVDQAAERRMWELLRQFMAQENVKDAGAWRPTFSQLQVAARAARDIQLSDQADLEAESSFDRIKFFNDVGDGLSRRVNIKQAKLVDKIGGLNPLHQAVRGGHIESTVALLEGGADINAVTAGDHSSPLLIATMNGYFDLAMLLLKRGADPNLANSSAGLTPLFAVLNAYWAPKTRHAPPAAAQQQQTSHLQLLTALLEAGANPNVRVTATQLWFSSKGTFDASVLGATPFWRAAFALDVGAMRVLVAHGADPNMPTLAEPEPDSAGGRRGRPQGGNPPQSTGGAAPAAGPKKQGAEAPPGPDAYPIHAATGLGYGERAASNSHTHVPDGWMAAVKYLVEELHADVTVPDSKGYTPLHNAAARGDHEMIFYLLQRGADIHAVTKKGATIADMANGPHQRAPPLPATVALLESLGSANSHKCQTC